MMKTPSYKNTWDLENLFKDGSHSSEFKHYLLKIESLVNDFEQNVRE